MLVLVMTAGVAEEERTDASGQWTYVVAEGSATITGCVEKPDGDLVIPGQLDRYPVTRIGYMAFMGCENLTSVAIPFGVVDIGDMAFMYCFNLADVAIPDSVTSIGEVAFLYCYSLEDVTIPGSVKSIGYSAFGGCGLIDVTLPGSVTSIGANPFVFCPLRSISVADGNPAYEQIEGVLFDKQQKMLVSYTGAWKGVYIIPDGVESIGEMAFGNCEGLIDVIIPDSVKSIGSAAFKGCSGLTGVIIPSGVTDIGDEAFADCEKLILVVSRGSAAAQYAMDNELLYSFDGM